MAFRTGFTQGEALQDAKNQSAWIKQRMQAALSVLSGTVNANQVFQLVDDVRAAIQMLNRDAAVPGIDGYAQDQYNDPAYDVSAEFGAMVSALNGVISWVVTNFPKDAAGFAMAYTIQGDGSRSAATFTSAQTAGLRSALSSAIATIE